MPDPSAGRPLPLPDAFTEEDVEALATVVHEMDGLLVAESLIFADAEEITRAALAFLAARSRLLPPSAEHCEEWTVRYTNLDGVRKEASAVFGGSQGAAGLAQSIERDPRCSNPVLVRRTVIDFVGSWVEVDGISA